MQLSLRPEIQRIIEERVRSGEFESPEAVVEAAIVRLGADAIDPTIDESRMESIEQAIDEIKAGHVRDWADVKAELRRKYLGG